MKLVRRRTLAAIAAGAALASSGPAWAQSKVLKFVQNGNLTILDPIWTTAYVTRNHGYFIYDTLFASDENNAVKPQMVDKYEVSPDKTVWTFTLRDGLEWHDGKPVTSEDCIASIKRWGARDAMGQKLMDFVKDFKAVDAKTFQMILKEPYGLVLNSLGKPSSQVPFIGMDLAGGGLRLGTGGNGPGPHFVVAHREEGDHSQNAVGRAHHPLERRRFEPEIAEEGGAVGGLEPRDLGFDPRCDHERRIGAPERTDLGLLGRQVLRDIDHLDEWLLGQELEAGEQRALIGRELQPTERASFAELRFAALEKCVFALVLRPLALLHLLPEPLPPFLDDLEIGDQELGRHRVGVRLPERHPFRKRFRLILGEATDHFHQRTRILDLGEDRARDALPALAPQIEPGHVQVLDRRRHLARGGPECVQPVEAGIRHPHHRARNRAWGACRHARAAISGQGMEERRLARPGQTDERDLHSLI